MNPATCVCMLDERNIDNDQVANLVDWKEYPYYIGFSQASIALCEASDLMRIGQPVEVTLPTCENCGEASIIRGNCVRCGHCALGIISNAPNPGPSKN